MIETEETIVLKALMNREIFWNAKKKFNISNSVLLFDFSMFGPESQERYTLNYGVCWCVKA